MKKILLACLIFVASVYADGKTFHKIQKCTKTQDRLICSQDGYNTEGFVYIFKDQKLYVHKSYFEDSFLGDRSPSQFLVFKAESYDYYKNDRGQNECHFTNVREIEEYYCYRENTKHYFQDKYGFKRMEILKDQSFEYCDEKFNKLLP